MSILHNRFVLNLLPMLAALAVCVPSSAVRPPRTASQMHVEEVASREPLVSGVVGVMAVTVGGDTLVAYNQDKRLVPASNVKLITTGVALHLLGADFRFETRLAHTGQIVDSTLVGDLYIVGGGDPLTGSKADCAEGLATTFSKWAKILRSNGIRAVKGRIIGDPRFFGNDTDCYSWIYEDLGTYYGAVPTGLNFFENAQNLTVTPGAAVGEPVKMEVAYPEAPWMNISNICTTSPAKCGDEMVYINTKLSPNAQLRGRYSVDRRRKTLECSNMFGAYTCAWYFRDYLLNSGIKVSGPAADVSPEGTIRTDLTVPAGPSAPPVSSMTVLGSSWSPRLSEIIYDTNHNSNNFFAESLMHMTGRRFAGSACYDSCLVAVKTALGSMGVNSQSGLRLQDGSGLSRKNYISPSFFVSFLRKMASLPEYGTYLRSLPQPGLPGTLEYRMKTAPDSTRDRIFMKSGSMNGVRCFSGYILSRDGDPSHTIVFSLMTNNVTASAWTAGSVIDDLISSIAAEN